MAVPSGTVNPTKDKLEEVQLCQRLEVEIQKVADEIWHSRETSTVTSLLAVNLNSIPQEIKEKSRARWKVQTTYSRQDKREAHRLMNEVRRRLGENRNNYWSN